MRDKGAADEIADKVFAGVMAGIERDFCRVTAIVLSEGQRDEFEWMLSPTQAARFGAVEGGRVYICAAPQSPDAPSMHLYLVEIVGVGVKVGISSQPEKRIATHTTAAAAFGRSVGRVWLSRPHPDARALETLIRGGHPNEYLPISFEVALQRALDCALTGCSEKP
jgi:hypothetical protein